MDRDEERDDELARLRAASEAIAPDDRFTDAIAAAIAEVDPSPDALAGIARATRSIDVEAGIAEAVMDRARAASPASSWMDGVVQTGPIAIALAAIAAAACLAVVLSGPGDVDASVGASMDVVEVIE
jgi:hypothetical protein